MHWLSTVPENEQGEATYSALRWILEHAGQEETDSRTRSAVASLIDHTLLRADATPEDVQHLCREAKEYQFAGVCVHSSYIPLCLETLEGDSVQVFSVAGFPFGADSTPAKAAEAELAVEAGAAEIDMVLHIGRLKAGEDDYVVRDIREVVRAAAGRQVKVILETALLSREEKIRACTLAAKAGARYVKTATGFAGGGATVDDVRLMRETVGPDLGVKAAGGIRTLADALAMIRAGASRIGTSRGAAIIQEPSD